jgi:tetratricopeptide (TPR) repeat protein
MDEPQKTAVDYERLATEKLIQGEFDQAMMLLGEAAKLVPSYLEQRAHYYAEAEEYEKAAQDYTTLINIWPDDPTLYEMRAGVQRIMGRFAEAVQDYSTLIYRFPPEASYYFKRGLTFWGLKHFDRAIEDLTITIRMKSEWDEPFFRRAQIYEETGDKQKSLEDAKTYLRRLSLSSPTLPFIQAMITRLEIQLAHKPIDEA